MFKLKSILLVTISTLGSQNPKLSETELLVTIPQKKKKKDLLDAVTTVKAIQDIIRQYATQWENILDGQVWGRDSVKSVTFSPDSRKLAIMWRLYNGFTPFNVTIFDLEKRADITFAGKNFLTIHHPTTQLDFPPTIRFSPDGSYLATGSCAEDGSVKIWDIQTGEQIKALDIGNNITAERHKLTYCPHSTYLAMAVGQKSSLFDARTGQVINNKLCTSRIGQIAFSHDGLHLACVDEDMTKVSIFSSSNGTLQQIITLPTSEQKISHILFSPDHSHIIIATNSNAPDRLSSWNIKSGKQIALLKRTDQAFFSAMALSLNQDLLAYCDVFYDWDQETYSSYITIWDTHTYSFIKKFYNFSEATNINTVAFSQDGKNIIGVGDSLFIWNIKTSELTMRLPLASNDFVLSPDQKFIVQYSPFQVLKSVTPDTTDNNNA